ncbi:hypothetical protein [Variovorax sp. dw_308]|uniref:hypothetical protein n=1 Tax=Variovorax sp. dw_308 TaxID=2721546 RepID=UPI001C4390F7|nr:hypothetical protein [Variovorax sp. dw_308]
MASELDELRARVEVLEAQQAIAISFVHFLLQALTHRYDESDRPALRAVFDDLFERTIAGILASDKGFPDISVQAVEVLREHMFGKPAGGSPTGA